jgi:5-methylcytosine-specific restriction endonuclease McrA
MSKKAKTRWKLEIKKSQNFKCAMCGKKFNPRGLTIHHCKNRSRGGKSNAKNCVAVCKECHKKIHEIYGNNYYDPRK